jgi:hypothetical protein
MLQLAEIGNWSGEKKIKEIVRAFGSFSQSL